ncbi:MAG: transcription elongation factor GreA, partial [Micromonosporaceae bacterium]|nr:transcription elongation factor GreA [Micromonosporaceae bacterium]
MSTSDQAPATTWLSADAYDRLQAELDELVANR